MSKDEELKNSQNGVTPNTIDFTLGLEKFLSEFDTETPIVEETTQKMDAAALDTESEKVHEGTEVDNRTDLTTEKDTEPENHTEEVVDLMTDASTSEVTGNLPSKEELSSVSFEEQMDAAIEKLVIDTVGAIGLNVAANEQAAKAEGQSAAVQQPEKSSEKEVKAPEQQEPAKPKKKMKSSVKLMLGLLVLVAAGLTAYYGYETYYFSQHFFPNTVINDVHAAELGVDEVESQIREIAENYKIEVDFRGDQTEVVNGSDIDYHYVSNGEVADLLDAQNCFLWFLEMNKNHENTVSVPMEFDIDKLEEKLEEFSQMNTENMVEPEDAYCEFKEDAFVILDEKEGTYLKKREVRKAVMEAITSGESSVNLEETGVYLEPKVRKDDQELVKHLNELNDWISGSVTYDVPYGEDIILDSKTLVHWLSADEKGLLVKNEDHWNAKLAEYVYELAEQVNTAGKAQSFPATGIGTIRVRQSGYGFSIDEEKEIEQLKEDLVSGEPVKRSPKWESTPFADDNNGFGYTYVEVDASRQHVWLYVDGDCVVSTDCVTGMMTTDRYTPSGIFSMTYKAKDTFLRGPVTEGGGYAWESHVDYWMPFNGGIGLHDASWRGSFGGSIYYNGGSHGCVNLPKWAAEEIYSYVYAGFPVVVYYSEGCKFE